MAEESRGVKEVENWLSPSEAGQILGTSGQWVTHLARSGKLDGVRTSLGWLFNPADVERLANQRLERAQERLSTLKAARSKGVAGARKSRRGRAKFGGSVSG
jgi:hypothetical protein